MNQENFSEQTPFPGPEVSTWNIHNLKRSYLEEYVPRAEDFVHTHFIRPVVRECITYLNDIRNDYDMVRGNIEVPIPTGKVFGSPGCGKSSTVWGWFQLQDTNKIWIHRKIKSAKIYYVKITSAEQGGDLQYTRGFVTTTDELMALLNNVTLIILNGAYSNETVSSLYFHAVNNRLLVISCTSGQSPEPIDEVLCYLDRDRQPVCYDGFTLEEYSQAHPLLYPQQVMTVSEFEERFFYAGGSARYFWGFRCLNSLIYALNLKIDRIKDYSRLFSGISGEGAEESVNTLKTYRDGRPVLVCEYIVRLLSEKIDRSFILTAMDVLPNNPSWLGFVAELDHFWRARKICQEGIPWRLRTILPNGDCHTGFAFHISKIEHFTALANLAPAAAIGIHSLDQVLLVPTLWCFRGYDAVYVRYVQHAGQQRPTPYVYFIQCTVSDRHSYLLHHLAGFLQQLFPLDNTVFNSPVVQYVLVTTKKNFSRLDITLGNVVDIGYVLNFDNTFQQFGSFRKYFFDFDTPYNRKQDRTFDEVAVAEEVV